MTIDEFFRKSKGSFPAVGVAAVHSEWMDVGPLEVPSGSLWAGDPFLMDDQRATVMTVPNGTYRVQVMGVDFKGHRRVGRARAWLDGGNGGTAGAGKVARGRRAGQTLTDSAWVGLCDFSAYKKAVTPRRAKEYAKDIAAATDRSGMGIIRFDYGVKSFEMALQPSGLGDGTFGVYPLTAKGKTVGMEVEFIPAGFKLEGLIPGMEPAGPADKKRAARVRQFLGACEKGKVDVVRRLLKEDPELIHARGQMGLTHGISALQFATSYGHADVAELLLKAGHPVDAVDEDMNTALSDAANYGQAEVARVLLKHKGSVSTRSSDGRTPLHKATYPMPGRAEVVRLLLAAGADPKARNDAGQTPLALANEYVGTFSDQHPELRQIIDLLTAATRKK